MEITCPRCETTFSADPKDLHDHHGQAKCSVCQHVFHVDMDSETRTAGRHLGQRLWRYWLLLIIFLLLLVLIGQILWFTDAYSYAANSAPIRQAMIRSADALGMSITWPGPNQEMRIVHSHVFLLGNRHAEITGKMENMAGHVQAYPVIQVTLQNAHGVPIAHLQFTANDYLPHPEKVTSGFLSHKPVPFILKSPELLAVGGYRVALLTGNPRS